MLTDLFIWASEGASVLKGNKFNWLWILVVVLVQAYWKENCVACKKEQAGMPCDIDKVSGANWLVMIKGEVWQGDEALKQYI